MEDVKKEFTEIIRNWVRSLLENSFDEACKQLAHDSDQSWDEEKIRTVILDYNNHEENLKIENPYEMNLEGERIEFYEFDDKTGWKVEYDIPINKQWSDLTAQFTFRENNGRFDFLLDDIHVL